MVLVGVLCLMPMDGLEVPGLQIPYLDKGVHFGFYLVGMVLGSLFLWERFRGSWKMKPAHWRMGLFLFLFGTIIELLQGATGFERSAEGWDLAANTLGILSGALAARFLHGWIPTFNWAD